MTLRLSQWFLLLFVSTAFSADLDWWKGGNFYQIYPRSFKDSDGDGIGDLQGIASKIPYLKDLGMDGVWLSPIMKSPQYDFGYDISDYRDVHWEYGTLADFDALVQACNENDVKLILDLVPNHSSHLHEWFIKSENREPGYENYYTWHPGSFDPKTGMQVPPSNWNSIFKYSAWTWSETRKQFYYHIFLKEQPDLNFRNKKVVQEMKDVITYWMARGVQGFRIDAVPHLFEVKPDGHGIYPDEVLSGADGCTPDDYCYVEHKNTQDQEETYDMIYQWRALMDEFATANGNVAKVIMTEAYSTLSNMIRYYGDGKRQGANVPFNFEMISNVNDQSTAKDYKLRIDNWLSRVPEGSYANWVLGNHDNARMASRLGVERTDLLNIMLQTLPGNAVTYNGEELGLENTHLTWEETQDPSACIAGEENYENSSRDRARTPFPWDATTSAGFSTNETTWLPVNTNYLTVNVAAQEAATNSHLKIFKKLTKWRKLPIHKQGKYEGKIVNDDNVLIYRRWYETDLAIIILNFGDTDASVNVNAAFTNITQTELSVYTSSLDTFVGISTATLAAVEVPSNKAVFLTNLADST